MCVCWSVTCTVNVKCFSTQVFLKLELVKIFLSLSFCCLGKTFMKLCKSLSFCRRVIMRCYRIDIVECNLEFMVFCYSYCLRVSPEHFICVWNYCAIFSSSVLLITDLFGFYLCSFLLPHDLTHLFCCWCLR